MRLTRYLVLTVLVLVVLGLVGCAATEQEKVWDSFVEAVAEKRVDEALTHVDFERMAQKAIGDDSEAQAALALLGGPEGAAKLMEGLFRDALGSAGGTEDAAVVISETGRPTQVETEGDYSTLTFKSDSGDFTIAMERIDGEWKIVDFGDALGETAEEGTEDSAQNWPGGPGSYSADDNGVVVTVDVPADASHELVAEIDAFRDKIGAAKVTYLVASIDNTNGNEESYIDTIKVVTEDGEQVEFRHVSAVMYDWYGNVTDDSVYNRGVELDNKHLNRTQVLPGARSETVFVATGQPPSIKSVWLDGSTQMKKEE